MISSKRFQKTVEDFDCEQCARSVQGGGYTNHCPHCLWSKHVDVFPGDRAHMCRGMMMPITVTGTSERLSVRHHCTACGHKTTNKVAEDDSMEAVLALVGSHGVVGYEI